MSFFGTYWGIGSTAPPVPTPVDGTTLLSSFVAWWNLTPEVQALTWNGMIWHRTAPEGANQLPYCTFFLVSDPVEIQTTDYVMRRATIQVNLYDDTDFGAEQAGTLFRELVKDAPLTVNGVPVMHCLPDTLGVQEGEGLGPNGEDCWVSISTLDIPYTE